jgi:hypothetical protein
MTSIAIPHDEIHGREHFPLPLVPMEQFMFWDDTVDYPKRFRVILDLRGDLKLEFLQAAILRAAVRHPMTVARLNDATKPPQWLIPERPEVPFRWLEASWSDPPFPDAWDLTTRKRSKSLGFSVHRSGVSS